MEIQTEEKLALLPYNHDKINDKHLVVNVLGDWAILEEEEFRRLNRYDVFEKGVLSNKLKKSNLLINNHSLEKRIASWRCLNLNLFCGPTLHIAVVTERCNLSCRYCQTRKDDAADMSIEVASQIIDFLTQNETPFATLEFQGGEPLCNWEVVKFLIERVVKLKKNPLRNKNIQFVLVTNLLLLDEKKLKFLINNNVRISSSLDGPGFIHDKNRVFANGRGSYKDVVNKIKMVKNEYKKRGIKKNVGLLPTITKYSLSYYKEIIDEYLKQGQKSIALRYINKLGKGQKSWRDLGVSTEDFCSFWAKSVDYIIKLNKQGKKIRERMLSVIAQKVLKKADPFYVDMMNPCGAGRSVLTYAPSGDVYTCDEARMLKSNLFKIGNVVNDWYYEIMDSSVISDTMKSSLLEVWDSKSPYKAWAGTCPVLNYAQQGSPVTKICSSRFNKIQEFQFRYFFDKIVNNEENLKIVKSWIFK
ncbi:MAG: His-Xaa-Ser system radical SAM maturase HxsB [Candidatus Omnitrophica bacterium]|nr:His-Xaa-Ser system radical SAM maturase HxsB [Candidatus Omnitrophota bacterium]